MGLISQIQFSLREAARSGLTRYHPSGDHRWACNIVGPILLPQHNLLDDTIIVVVEVRRW